jgi:hypothetical protein
VTPRSRFGHDQPTHRLLLERLRARDDHYRTHLEGIMAVAEDLAVIPVHGDRLAENEPRWWNGWIPGLDAAALYARLVQERPRTYMEDRSGNSTSAGVHVQFHDIVVPDDYPDAWNDRYYSEHYVLAAFVLGGDAVFRTELPGWYVTHHAPDLAAIVASLFERLPRAERHGHSF